MFFCPSYQAYKKLGDGQSTYEGSQWTYLLHGGEVDGTADNDAGAYKLSVLDHAYAILVDGFKNAYTYNPCYNIGETSHRGRANRLFIDGSVTSKEIKMNESYFYWSWLRRDALKRD